MKYLILSCLLSGVLLSCQNKAVNRESSENDEKEEVQALPAAPIVIPFEKGVDIVQVLSLSQIALNVEYIPLETSSTILLSRAWENLVLTKEYIFVYGGTKSGFFQFDRQGKFIRKIAKKGQGPGEYVYLSDFVINEEQRHIYILSSHTWKILVYDFDGNHIKDFQAPKDQKGFEQLSDSLFVTFALNSRGDTKDKLTIFDVNGDVVKTYPHEEKFTVDGNWSGMVGGPMDRYLYKIEGKVRHKDFYNDTLFTVTPDGLLPEYIIPMGKYQVPPEKRFERTRGDMKMFNTYANSYFRVNVNESADYLFFTYNTWKMPPEGKERLTIYNKKTEEIFTVKNNEIEDDLQHIYPFFPVRSIQDQLIGIVQPVDIIEWKENKGAWKQHPELKGLKEDSNPIIVVVTLRNSKQ